MKLNLLLVSIDKFPSEMDVKIQEYGFICSYARGRLKAKELLDHGEINGILWHYRGYSEALAMDLVSIFNQHLSIPIVLLISEIEAPEHLKTLQSKVLIVDINDDVKEILMGIEDLCFPKTRSNDTKSDGPELHEIDFKQVMKPIISGDKNQFDQIKKGSFNLLTPWSAVGNQEKVVISKPYDPATKNLIRKFVEKLKQVL